MVVLLGLAAAIAYGIGDFVGAFASRRHGAVTVLLHSYPVGAVLMIAMLPFFPGTVTARTVVFGVAGGLAGLVGVTIMYGLMVVAPMNVISPITAVMAAIVPVVFGVLVGERPHVAAWLGILLGVGAVVLVSRTTDDHPHGRIAARVIALAFVSGLGFGCYFIFLAARHGLLSLASVLTSLYPAVTVMLAVGLLHEHASRIQRVGLALAAAAIVLITI